MSLIQKRRSIRKFLAKQVEPGKIDLLAEAALRAPSSRGLQPWEFIFIADRTLIEKLSRSKQHGSSFLKNAPLAIVVCADPERSDVWIEDSSIACIFIQLTAESLGLGSCWIQIRERMHDDAKTAQTYISEILNIPPRIEVESLVAAGYPDEKPPPRAKDELLYERVYLDLYGRPYANP
jgi:nitroreductase